MRTYIYNIIALCACLLMTGCFDDDSTMGTNAVGDITVSGMESSYTRTAYIGEKLAISPTVESGYGDDGLDYEWLLLSGKTGTTTTAGDTIQPVVIGTEKNLDYEVSIAPGTYQIRYVVTSKANGYKAYTAASLVVQTDFTSGFYILKETADGDTELDMLNNNDKLGEDIYTQTGGAPLQGKPLFLGTNYNLCYINADDNAMDHTNAITVTTTGKDIRVSRTTDFTTIFDRHSILFDDMDADEQPYGIAYTGMGYQVYLSSNGIRYAQGYSEWSDPNSGKFGMPLSDGGGSRFIVNDIPSNGGIVYWDETSHSLMATDYNLNASPLVYSDYTGSELTEQLTDYDCLYMGYNLMNSEGTATTILENKTDGKRYLYLTQSDFMGIYLKERKEIAAGSHMADATAYSTNGQTAKYIYCIDGGHLYACIFDNDELSEIEIKPQGISADETINFVTNQFWNPVFSSGDAFDYLIVGTQKGGAYHLYMYETVGGAPQNDPVKSVSGQGTVKSVRWLNPDFSTTDWSFGYYTFNIND